jgi:putative Mg2+ transporter-C (MgtC) family protein
MSISTGELLLRLGLAAALGAVIGFEREVQNHPAGARTHSLVALGSALFTVAGAYGFTDAGDTLDPARVAGQVATGVGFIGAGAILRVGLNVRGLTTAATLWLAASLGVAMAAGAYPAAFIATAATIILLLGLQLLRPIMERPGRRTLQIVYEPGHGTLGPVVRGLEQVSSFVGRLHIADEHDAIADRSLRTASLDFQMRDPVSLLSMLEELRARPEVRDVYLDPPLEGPARR